MNEKIKSNNLSWDQVWHANKVINIFENTFPTSSLKNQHICKVRVMLHWKGKKKVLIMVKKQ